MIDFNVTADASGLGTVVDLKVPDAGAYFVSGKLTLPSIPAGSATASAVVVVVNKNGSPVYTGNAGSRGFYVIANCSALDEITVVLSSAATVDLQSNAIRSTVTVGIGS